MTLFNPRLRISRLIVKKGDLDVYNAAFHPRLNVISGENSSGKSTLLDFIFYALGGELTEWREAALSCSEVILEVALNGRPAVFAREIAQSTGRPMRIFMGSLDDAYGQASSWGLYPYRRSDNKESFSQVIFRLLGMPEAAGDATSNVTIHQMLRLLYADQLSPVDRIFRFERFDTALTRQTVGDLLCGAYDDTLYRNKIRLREADDTYKELTAEWKNLTAPFLSEKHAINLDWIEAERRSLNDELAEVHRNAEELESRIFHAEVSNGLTLEEQNRTYNELIKAQQKIANLRSSRDSLQLEIADSDRYIKSLETKLDQLRDAEITADSLKGISFMFCPSCYASVDQEENEHACTLCKNPFERGRAQSRILAIINDVGIQLKQSRSIQEDRLKEALDFDIAISAAYAAWNGLNEKYKLLNRVPSTELRAQARALYSRAGYLERQIEDLAHKQATVERIDAISKSRQLLNIEMTELRENIDSSERRQREQLSRAYSLISSITIQFLKGDLARQDTFSKAESIQFSFSDDRFSVNGESFFSASSMVYLRNSFFAAFFKASLIDPAFRHPRFLILDTIEDKGMEPERSHRFQNLLADTCLNSLVENQLIYATAMISPELENSEFIVDRFYTHNDRSLKVARPRPLAEELDF